MKRKWGGREGKWRRAKAHPKNKTEPKKNTHRRGTSSCGVWHPDTHRAPLPLRPPIARAERARVRGLPHLCLPLLRLPPLPFYLSFPPLPPLYLPFPPLPPFNVFPSSHFALDYYSLFFIFFVLLRRLSLNLSQSADKQFDYIYKTQ